VGCASPLAAPCAVAALQPSSLFAAVATAPPLPAYLEDVLAADVLALLPCGHRCVCAGCADLVQARPLAKRNCPACSKPVTGALRVFDIL
jgi:hypothetical protein